MTDTTAEPAPAPGAAPREDLDALLEAQMAAVHEAAMRALKRAGECTGQPQIEALYLRQAARLMHLFTRQMEARDRRRRADEARAEAADAHAAAEARKAYYVEKDARQEEERLYHIGLGPKPRRRPLRPGGRGNGTGSSVACAPGNGAGSAAIELPEGPFTPGPASGGTNGAAGDLQGTADA